jgi:hypothetical protein
VLIGDSIDRSLVEAACPRPANPFVKSFCAKCIECTHQNVSWLNIMHFGSGYRGCYHRDSAMNSLVEVQPAAERIRTLLPLVLRTCNAARRETLVVAHSGLWDVRACNDRSAHCWLCGCTVHTSGLQPTCAVARASPSAGDGDRLFELV